MDLEIGANVGAALEQATSTQGKAIDVAKPAAAKKNIPPQTDNQLILVGIEMIPNDPDKITLDAQQHQKGRIFVGPMANWAWIHTDYAAFISGVRTYTIQLNRFNIDLRNGRISRGSLVCDPSGAHACPVCKHVLRVPPSEFKKMQRAQKTRHPYCAKCGPNAKYAWKADPEPAISPDDTRLKRMWDSFVSYRDVQVPETTTIVPRVWGVYPINQAPTEWRPADGDVRAQTIEEREHDQGLTIRPFTHAYKAESRALEALTMEATLTDDVKAGMAVGWMSAASLGGSLTQSEDYGYTVRLANNNKRQMRKGSVV